MALLAAACGGSGSGEAGNGATNATAPANGDASAPAGELADWQTVELTDADGETFALSDFVGRPVLVENFATWCSNCRQQLGDTQQAARQAGDDAVFVALSVETELDESDMRAYAKRNGFSDIRFAVMSPELLALMNDAYGNSSLNPPSTPKIKVAADGKAGELVTGYESVDEILGGLGLG